MHDRHHRGTVRRARHPFAEIARREAGACNALTPEHRAISVRDERPLVDDHYHRPALPNLGIYLVDKLVTAIGRIEKPRILVAIFGDSESPWLHSA